MDASSSLPVLANAVSGNDALAHKLQAVDPGANIIFGVTLDESMGDEEIKIVLIATVSYQINL
jgi:cell division GTPase FtsZ